MCKYSSDFQFSKHDVVKCFLSPYLICVGNEVSDSFSEEHVRCKILLPMYQLYMVKLVKRISMSVSVCVLLVCPNKHLATEPL